ncbi:MAG: MarR family transcriptional regulator [Spirochaetales bacterium]|nr:MarR family transcriptional regulator [Spirochaetales bacterium]
MIRKMQDYPQLRLSNQLCFPLYACSKELVRCYAPLLEPYSLTYTHYITMMVIWEKGEVTVSELGKALYLDSGTLSPVLKRLESNCYIRRTRKSDDERCVVVTPTEEGLAIQEKLKDVPKAVGCCLNLDASEAATLYGLLYKMLSGMC